MSRPEATEASQSVPRNGPPHGPSPHRDPEFGLLAVGPSELVPSDIAPESYLRIAANPFLGLAGLVAWLMVGKWFLTVLKRSPELIGPLAPILVILLIASLWLLPYLFHYHCLDCGGSGRLSRWTRHACPTSVYRRLAGRPRRWRGPTPFTQIVLWLWLALSLAVLAEAIGLRRPFE